MNYRRAAEELHLTQPAVTKHIQSLEDEYGVELFHYDGRKLQRSEKSYLLENYAYSQRINYEQILESLKEKSQKQVRIGLTKTIGEYVIFDHLVDYIRVSNDLIDIKIDNTDHLLEALRENSLDFLVLEGNFDKGKYAYQVFSEELFTGICSSQHPFANKRVAMQDVLEECCIVREDGSGSRNILESLLYLKGHSITSFQKHISISSIHLIKKLIKKDIGVTFAYDKILKEEKDISTFEVDGITTYHEFNIVAIKNTSGLEKAKEFFRKNKKNM